jgi:hypothetical protein
MGLVDFARAELEFLIERGRATAEPGDEEAQREMNADILRVVEIFADQGHSGSTAPYAIGIISKLLSYEALSPLTGEPDEWTRLEYGPDMGWQNKRCSHVFKRDDGTAYDIEGRVFREPSGACYTGSESRVEVTFPYTPVREYVDVDDEGNPMPDAIHPAPVEFTAAQLEADPILQYFHYAHLPPVLAEISQPFCSLAGGLVATLPRNPERTVALRKLLEAKDCAVRANVKPKAVRDFDEAAPVEGEIKRTGGDKSETPVPFDGA